VSFTKLSIVLAAPVPDVPSEVSATDRGKLVAEGAPLNAVVPAASL
jgi:hypothetical protein